MDGTWITDLNWNLLRSFHVIAEEQNLTRAAARLGVSQPSVTNALRKLEDQLGCQLVLRDSRRFELTPRGVRVQAECAEIFRSVSSIDELVRDGSLEARGEVRVQLVTGLRSPLLDEALRLYHQRHPAVSYRIEVESSAEIVRNLQEGRLGLGICLLSRPVMNLDCSKLFREEFAMFCGREHPLFGRSDVTLRELQREPFIAFDCAGGGTGLEPMAVLQQGARLGAHVSGSSPSLQEVRRMIMCGLGIGVLPVVSVTHDVERGDLWPLPIPGQQIGADVFLVTNPATTLTPAEERFAHLLNELLNLYPDYA